MYIYLPDFLDINPRRYLGTPNNAYIIRVNTQMVLGNSVIEYSATRFAVFPGIIHPITQLLEKPIIGPLMYFDIVWLL